MNNTAIKVDSELEVHKKIAPLTYLEWNNKIARQFFNSNKLGTRVWFSVEKDLIKKITQENNTNFNQFIETVKKGPDWVNRDNQKVCIKARDTFKAWRKKNLEYPPYIAYLALFVLAVNHNDSENFSENDYYGRLRNLLEEKPSTGQYPSFEKMSELWDDLEKWSSKDKENKLGEFYHDIYGKHFHVGIPYYQVVLSTEDRSSLSEIFWKMGWDSDSNPTEEEILFSLKKNKDLLSNRTSNRIEKGKPDFLRVLIDRVLEELKEYDDEILENSRAENEEAQNRGFIDIYLEIDETAKKITSSFRCRRKAGLPEGEFLLTDQTNTTKKVPSFLSTISDKIINFNIDWEKSLSVKSKEYTLFHYRGQKYTLFHYRGQKYKLFTPAKDVSGWASGQRYIPDKLFYLAVHKSLFDKAQKWGEKECNECQELKFSGLPDNWHLFKIKGVKRDSIKKDIPDLAIDKKQRIKFEGGIRLSKGNKFFSFAPPKIILTGGLEQISSLFYSINNKHRPLLFNQTENSFSLPTDVSDREWITISDSNKNTSNIGKGSETQKFNKKDSEKITPKKLFLDSPRLKKLSDCSKNQDNLISFPFGQCKDISNIGKESETQKFNKKDIDNYDRFPDISMNPEEKIYLVGSIPGQISIWPYKFYWNPIWLIQFKNHKKAVAYWTGNLFSHIEKPKKFSEREIQLWKNIVWHKRKRITPDKQKKWKEFLKRIKDV